jgi:hypothetical protein
MVFHLRQCNGSGNASNRVEKSLMLRIKRAELVCHPGMNIARVILSQDVFPE